MSERPFNVAVIGLGAFGEWHCRILAQLPGVRLLAVASSSLNRRGELAARYGVPHSVATIAELVAVPGLQAIVVASASRDHAAQVRVALGAGKHVLVEKPFVASAADARALADLALSQQRHLQVGFLSRFELRFAKIREAIERAELGRVATMSFARSVSRSVATSGRYGDIVSETMSHDVDLALWWGGERVVRVEAAVQCSLELAQPDSATAHCLLEGGASVLLRADWLLPDAAPRNIAEGARSLLAHAVVVGARGRVEAKLLADDLAIWTDDRVLHPLTGLQDSAFGLIEGAMVRQAQAFVAAAQGAIDATMSPSMRDVLHGMEVCAAIHTAAQSQRGVNL